MVAIKFCGLTREEDVRRAAELGASYAGVIFAGGPRNRTTEQATALFAYATSLRRVGVIRCADHELARERVRATPLDVVQLHADPSDEEIARARETGAEIWAVARIAGGVLHPEARRLFLLTDAVVLDTKAESGLGGTGRTFDWRGVAEELTTMTRRARLVVAGGLNPSNVAEAIRVLRPDVVDVSSGVESAPGVKDPDLMRRFVEAVRSA
jgi:phosphoribosylanthranilate isomerase